MTATADQSAGKCLRRTIPHFPCAEPRTASNNQYYYSYYYYYIQHAEDEKKSHLKYRKRVTNTRDDKTINERLRDRHDADIHFNKHRHCGVYRTILPWELLCCAKSIKRDWTIHSAKHDYQSYIRPPFTRGCCCCYTRRCVDRLAHLRFDLRSDSAHTVRF